LANLFFDSLVFGIVLKTLYGIIMLFVWSKFDGY
jgi:hypothetical protein